MTTEARDFVKSHVDIVQVIGEYVRLRKVGPRHTGLCPFHREKTPSLSVSAKEQFFKCFGCSAGGDVFSFVMRMEGVTFPESMKRLAEHYGLAVPGGEYKAPAPRDRPNDADRLAFAEWWWQERIASLRADQAYFTACAEWPKVDIERHDDGTVTVAALGPVSEDYAWAECLGRMIRWAERLSPAERVQICHVQKTGQQRKDWWEGRELGREMARSMTGLQVGDWVHERLTNSVAVAKAGGFKDADEFIRRYGPEAYRMAVDLAVAVPA